MPLELEVIPEQSLRNEYLEFILGMPIRQAIATIQKMCLQIKGVDLVYCQEDPLTRDIIINLSNDGIRLIFDSYTQRLMRIEVFDFGQCILRYCSTVFSTPNGQATVGKVEQCFGATHPGVYDAKQQVYVLNWRGLSFSFPTESVVQPNYAHGLGSLQFSEGSSPFVSKMCIFQGTSLADTKIPSIPIVCYSGNCYLDQVQVVRSNGSTVGLKLRMQSEVLGGSRFPDTQIELIECSVCFGDSVQDVLNKMGSPGRVFYKSEDKMRIHRPSGDRQRTNKNVDYFFNYFTLGMDILFDAEAHTVKKFLLHTNYPGHFDFGIYDRCNFQMTLEDCNGVENMNEDLLIGDLSPITLTPSSKWEEVQKVVCVGVGGEEKVQPVVLNRSSSSTNDNPFGSTLCYGHSDIIFEVMRNGHLASVTLFSESSPPSPLITDTM